MTWNPLGQRRHAMAAAASLWALVALNAYRPLWPRSRNGSVASWFVGVMTSEFPLTAALGQLFGMMAARRASGCAGSRLTWALATLSWVGLAGLHRSARGSDRLLTGLLDESFGARRVKRIEGLWSASRNSSLRSWASRTVLATMCSRRRYCYATDVAYGPHGTANLLDIWRRSDLDPARRAPVIIQIHGGGWIWGSKRGQGYPLMSHLAAAGWVCVPINYRLSLRGNTWPDHVVDVKRAIAWVKAHIADYGGDPEFVVVTGGSAGGHLAALAALTPGLADFQPGFEDADTRIQAAVSLYGLYDFCSPIHGPMLDSLERSVFKASRAATPDVYRSASPITYVNREAPPFFVVHGSKDFMCAGPQARAFVQQLRQASQQVVVYAELPNTQHAFDGLASRRTVDCVSAIEQFLAEVYVRRQQSTLSAGNA